MAAAVDSPESRDSSAPGAEGGSSPGPVPDSPVCLIVLGMAGSGKTTFVQVRQRVTAPHPRVNPSAGQAGFHLGRVSDRFRLGTGPE